MRVFDPIFDPKLVTELVAILFPTYLLPVFDSIRKYHLPPLLVGRIIRILVSTLCRIFSLRRKLLLHICGRSFPPFLFHAESSAKSYPFLDYSTLDSF